MEGEIIAYLNPFSYYLVDLRVNYFLPICNSVGYGEAESLRRIMFTICHFVFITPASIQSEREIWVKGGWKFQQVRVGENARAYFSQDGMPETYFIQYLNCVFFVDFYILDYKKYLWIYLKLEINVHYIKIGCNARY